MGHLKCDRVQDIRKKRLEILNKGRVGKYLLGKPRLS